MAGRYGQGLSPGPPASPLRPMAVTSDTDKYLAELLNERHKLSPFMQVLPNCSRLLTAEIQRVTRFIYEVGQDGSFEMASSSFTSLPFPVGDTRLRSPSYTSAGSADFGPGWTGMQTDMVTCGGVAMQAGSSGAVPIWPPSASAAGGIIVKRARRLDIPVDKHPNFNFVGRILGPRGNSLKRVEATTGCRVLIRGKGSIKDPHKEEKLKDKVGYEHLNEPLHVIIEAEMPASVAEVQLSQAVEVLEELLKPVDENYDVVKRAQLRELAILNGTLREGSPGPMQGIREGSPGPMYGGLPPHAAGPFNGALKRAKTRR